ncbi:universal stress protein [Streptomyces lunaelactis]|uniref:universal stress protein n=1 Tax=Streptomyces lunaelactis TaxID=1535768 RepID=UPI001584BC92|nr:universal stress protein [Streptomyces lunaelactis]NUK06477.1 universal stress protein [Streptomyces lunaelactis]NUL08206.1 universal stress protein [Streptomyces lunaelactis]NUL24008.1 universal stress protein [Streptomyces lunaelactis]
MDRSLYAGVDGSEPSLRALDWAVDEAAAHGAPLTVVHSWRWEQYESHEPSFGVKRGSSQVFAENITGSALARAERRSAALKVTSDLTADDPVTALIQASREASAVVVGSRGRGELAGLLLGSVGLAVAARAVSPVIVVRGEEANLRRGFHRIVVGIDEPEKSRAALEFALREAEVHGATLCVVHAWRCPAREIPDHPDHRADTEQHTRHAEELLGAALRLVGGADRVADIQRAAVEGPARPALLDAVLTADLLVVGARRRTGHLGMQLGPVNHAVLHQAACPVAVIPHE